MQGLPTYAELLLRQDAPAGSTWHLFADTPERGMANLASKDAVLAASKLIRTGEVFSLDYTLDRFEPSLSASRTPPQQTILARHDQHRDDRLDGFWPQASSHIDGLRHRRHALHGFYGGTDTSAITPGTPALGIQHWAEHPIVGRGVLLDISRYRDHAGQPIDHAAGEALSVGDLTRTLLHQQTELTPGSLLLIRTGWAEWFLNLPEEERRRVKTQGRATGFSQSRDLLEWIWDNRVAMAASDTFALEVMPPIPDSTFGQPDDHGMMHQELIALLGLPIGELWNLESISMHAATVARYECFVSAKPLGVVGGVGSPANAMAIW